MLHKLIFPQLDGLWLTVNLNYWAIRCFSSLSQYNFKNPLINPEFCRDWVEDLHRHKNCDFTYGGYCERRDTLWRGHYMTDHIHYGIDFNVPTGTAVHIPVDAEIYSTRQDKDQNGGWGGHMTFRRDDGSIFIMAHLNPDRMNNQDQYKAGDVIGYVGDPTHNGGWYPHLHVQCIDLAFLFENNITDIDGYGPDSPILREAYPNPQILSRR